MNSFNIRVADYVFEIRPLSEQMRNYCEGYITSEQPECVIEMSQQELAYEQELSSKEAAREGRPFVGLPDAMLENCAVHRKVSDYVTLNQGAMIHGALIEKDEKGYLFIAKSGIGKTTHIMNWLKAYDDVTVVNGDKPILRLKDDGIYGYGTPWCGKERLGSNKSVKLENMIILERAGKNYIERVHFMDYMNQLLTQIHIPNDREGLGKTFKMIHYLSKTVKLYKLGCNMNLESAITAYEGMRT